MPKTRLPLLLIVAALFAAGCQTAYFSAMEQIGYHKRDLLVGRVEAARDSQEEAKEQFASALDEFKSVVDFDGGDLEERYEELSEELEESEEDAEEVRERIAAVDSVAEALFDEWEDELDQYSSDSLRKQSERKLKDTRARYKPMIESMRRAESKMEPVLAAFRDQVLFLKHNLNAKAVASLKGELASIETDIDALVRDMEASVAEADSFIQALEAA